ncbi:hypothetical protein RF11_10461 [Thelohanellus kitauei]|uniref:Uncharacterized protein n=1 Tax=Thelohanellus kitauei TaxID=669202 RepID=A0A0C2N6D1_THEKT|nr:hypothetical protein RF11_10461 [Thelohanellus kitauei]
MAHWLICGLPISTNSQGNQLPLETLPLSFNGENDHYELVTCRSASDFIIFYKKEEASSENDVIYGYDKTTSAFKPITFDVHGTVIKSLKKLIPVENKMFAISNRHEVAFYINERYEIENVESIEHNTEFVMHPEFLDFAIKYTVSEVS